jgi:hypothetical protein
VVLEWKIVVFFTPNVRRERLRIALKRTSDSGIFESFSWSVQGRQNIRSAAPLVSGGGLSAVTIPAVEAHLHERSLALAASRHSRRWMPSCDGEACMLVTEQDAIMKKWCPMSRLRWESRPFAYNRSNPGRSARFRNMLYRIFFPTPAPRHEGAFLPTPGVGLHDVAMGDQSSAPTRAAQGIPISDAQGLLWLGRLARHADRAMMDRALRGAGLMPIFRHCLGKRRVNATL